MKVLQKLSKVYVYCLTFKGFKGIWGTQFENRFFCLNVGSFVSVIIFWLREKITIRNQSRNGQQFMCILEEVSLVIWWNAYYLIAADITTKQIPFQLKVPEHHSQTTSVPPHVYWISVFLHLISNIFWNVFPVYINSITPNNSHLFPNIIVRIKWDMNVKASCKL